MPRRLALGLAAGLAALLLAAPASHGARRAVPQGWLGTMVDGPLLERPALLESELGAMVAGGVETVRVAAYWRDMQPYRRFAAVPARERRRFRNEHGVPTDFSSFDRLVAAAARRRLRVLPAVVLTPRWASVVPGLAWSPPSSATQYARFVAALASRYGTYGTFWLEAPSVPKLPIRAWQVWNEPNARFFWRHASWTRRYVRLLRETRRAVRAVDPSARIVLGGLVNRSWTALEEIYRARGRGTFDVAAVHPFTRRARDVVRILRLVRGVMARYRDRRRPVWVTELSWPSARGRTSDDYGFSETRAGQARRLRSALPLLARQRRRLRLGMVVWYTWLTRDRSRVHPFDHAGLRRLDASGRVLDKPAASAFRSLARRLEGCRKGGRADRCA